MEPIQILEAIKEDIRDKFDGDPLMMRTMNLVITEYKARSERLHKPVVMQAEGSDVSEGAAVASEGRGEANTCADAGCPKCKSTNLFDVDDHWTKCDDCGFTFVG